MAATVRFDEKLKTAVAINVQSTADILDLGKDMQKLKVKGKQFMYAFKSKLTHTISLKPYSYFLEQNQHKKDARNFLDSHTLPLNAFARNLPPY